MLTFLGRAAEEREPFSFPLCHFHCHLYVRWLPRLFSRIARKSRKWNDLCYLLDWKPFKSDEKWFLFHLKSYFRSQDILVFVTTFRSCRKSGLIRRVILTSKLMASQPGLWRYKYKYNTNIQISHKVKLIRTWNLVN